MNAAAWRIELEGSELSRVELNDTEVVIVLAAARVHGGHLQGVRVHLAQAHSEGATSGMVGRLDEVDWTERHTSTPGDFRHRGTLAAPSRGDVPVSLSLRTAWGDTLAVHAQAWRVEVAEDWRFTPSLAC